MGTRRLTASLCRFVSGGERGASPPGGKDGADWDAAGNSGGLNIRGVVVLRRVPGWALYFVFTRGIEKRCVCVR